MDAVGDVKRLSKTSATVHLSLDIVKLKIDHSNCAHQGVYFSVVIPTISLCNFSSNWLHKRWQREIKEAKVVDKN